MPAEVDEREEEIVGLHFTDDREIPGLLPTGTHHGHGVVVVRSVPSSDPADLPSIKFDCPDGVTRDLARRHGDLNLPALSIPAEDIYVVVSIKSGTGKAESVYENVLAPALKLVMECANPRYNVVKTESHESVLKLASGKLRGRADQGFPQTVILLSGDGGIVDLVNGLLLSGRPSSTYVRPTIFLFPLGTGNALFHSIHRRTSEGSAHQPAKPRSDITTALRTLFRGTLQPLPIFRATFSPSARFLSNEGRDANPIPHHTFYGAVVASYGLHATLVADSDTTEWRKHGDKRFGLVAKDLLSPAGGGPPHAYKARVILKKKRLNADGSLEEHQLQRDEHGYVLLAMVSNLEKAFTISPASKPMDGHMRVVHFGPESGEEVMRIMGMAYQEGKHVEDGSGKVGYDDVEEMRIEMLEGGQEGTWRRVCIDGLIVRIEEGGWIDISKVDERGLAIDVVIGEQHVTVG